jgi:hypothetical protein
MADQLYLSYRLRGYTENNMLRHFEKMLRKFPFSRLSAGSTLLRVNAVSATEPPLLEKAYEDPVNVDVILAAAREFQSGDCGVQLESYWDLWQFEAEPAVVPTRVTLACFGPLYDDAEGDHLRIEFGLDALFLPQPDGCQQRRHGAVQYQEPAAPGAGSGSDSIGGAAKAVDGIR